LIKLRLEQADAWSPIFDPAAVRLGIVPLANAEVF